MDTLASTLKKMERKRKQAIKSARFSKNVTLLFAITSVLVTVFWWPHETSNLAGKLLIVTWLVILGLIITIVYTNFRTTYLKVRIIRPLIVLTLIYSILWCTQLGSIGFLFGGIFAGLLFASIPYTIYAKTADKYIGFGNVRMAFCAGILLGFLHTFVCLLVIALLFLTVYVYKCVSGTYSKKKRIIGSSEVGLMWGVAILISMIFGHIVL